MAHPVPVVPVSGLLSPRRMRVARSPPVDRTHTTYRAKVSVFCSANFGRSVGPFRGPRCHPSSAAGAPLRVDQMLVAAEVIGVGVAVVGLGVRLRQLLPGAGVPGADRLAALPRRVVLLRVGL